MGDTFSLKITDKVLYIQYLDRSRYDRHGWWKCRFSICPGMDGSRAMQELLPRSSTPVDSTDLFRIIQLKKEIKMVKEIISTDKAPQAIGTYSQAVKTGSTVYLSGQIPLNPETMEMVEGDIKQQIHRVFKNLQAVANAAGGDLADIVKLNIFLTDLSNFPQVNEVMAEYFQQPYPARAAIGVSALPKDAGVEMDAVVEL